MEPVRSYEKLPIRELRGTQVAFVAQSSEPYRCQASSRVKESQPCEEGASGIAARSYSWYEGITAGYKDIAEHKKVAVRRLE